MSNIRRYANSTYLLPPIIMTPLLNDKLITTSANVSVDNPRVAGQNIVSTTIQWSTSSTFASGTNTKSVPYVNTDITTITGLARNTKYYIRAQFVGSKTGATAWSSVVPFIVSYIIEGDSWLITNVGTTYFTVPQYLWYKVEVAGGSGGDVRIARGGFGECGGDTTAVGGKGCVYVDHHQMADGYKLKCVIEGTKPDLIHAQSCYNGSLVTNSDGYRAIVYTPDAGTVYGIGGKGASGLTGFSPTPNGACACYATVRHGANCTNHPTLNTLDTPWIRLTATAS